jgi:RNA polymerase sigma factor for flagellar operon FliA
MEPDDLQEPFDAGAADPSGVRADAEARLWKRWREDRDEAARDELARLHLPFARIMAARLYAGRFHDEIEFAEYYQFAGLGLMEAIDRYEPGRGAQFRTFAALRIRGAILNGLPRLTERQRQIEVRKNLRAERLASLAAYSAQSGQADSNDTLDPSARHADALFRTLADVGIGLALGVLLEDTGMVEADSGIGPERYFRAAELAQLRSRLLALMRELPERDRSVLELHYEQEIPFVEIAARMGVTKGRIAQIHHRALDALRARLTASGMTDRSF